ncbi:MAG: SDR family oxidoreductase [Chloroflexi bacterium]|nr:SDR family oxidoreductase [Chloroflexota bacterium]
MTNKPPDESTPDEQASVRDMFDMTGRVVIVTGGGTHLGRAMATAMAELGASVTIASRRRDLCEQVAGEMRSEGLDVTAAGCDVTVEDQVNSLVNSVVADKGKIDVIVCNAGGARTTRYLPDASIDEFKETMDLNATSTYICAQAAARHMIPARYGRIITIGSIHGFLTSNPAFYEGLNFQRSGPPYQAAKAAIINLTRALASELGPHGITANCISPGQIPRPGNDPEMNERARKANALGQVGQAEDLKGAVALLASDAGRWITGHNLIVDGGWSIW